EHYLIEHRRPSPHIQTSAADPQPEAPAALRIRHPHAREDAARPGAITLVPPDPLPERRLSSGEQSQQHSIQINSVEVRIERPEPPPAPAVVRRDPVAASPPLSRAFGAWGLRQS